MQFFIFKKLCIFPNYFLRYVVIVKIRSDPLCLWGGTALVAPDTHYKMIFTLLFFLLGTVMLEHTYYMMVDDTHNQL